MSIVAEFLSNGFGPLPRLGDILGKKITHNVEEDDLEVWDKGIFINELLKQGIAFNTGKNGDVDGSLAAPRGLRQGTYKGTRMALTEIYSLIEEAVVSHLDVRGFEPIIPRKRDLSQKQDVYKWSNDAYPPHLLIIPAGQEEGPTGVGDIFNAQEKASVGQIATVFGFIIPEVIDARGTPFEGPTLAECEQYNREHPSPKTDIMNGENIGNLADWYSDARFAQQHLSGVNPSTIEAAQSEKVDMYIAEAEKQGLDGMSKLLSEGTDLFIQDYSYFREAMKLSDKEPEYRNIVPEMTGPKGDQPTGKMVFRYGCAPVVIFQLHCDGRLHPLAITVDHKGNLDKSITLFNQRLTPDATGEIDEKDDWAWRYAKTCAQTADWARHEVATHLVDTHMVEEAIIVATNRTIPEDHILYETLSPHWFRTLAVNKAARDTLVPAVVARLAGFGPTIDPKTSRVMDLLDWSYKNFNFQDKYIPNDLKKRGFKTEALTERKYRNYPYATDMYLLWGVIHDFVKSVLGTKYKSDADVRRDPYIADWCKELQTNGQIPSFPTITTLVQLIDATTMCIHTASPQHTAVNYLQDYYYSFVPAKPPALCTPLPKDLATLQKYTEADLTAALPIGTEGPKWKDWLLAAQLPELLSYKVDGRYNLMTYAKSLYNINKSRTNFENREWDSKTIKSAAALLYSRLKELDTIFKHVSDRQTEGTIEYLVLQPEVTAVSILI
ncbi:Lipoxygenase [Didymella exigua CBS 183.55]|uniref:Manganese lipoxygenase n=1 Tax=Didymella exigua CBS 183.55 TaxID=1150837 RepID=A0A6A5RH91_9PLEO|nr:Lipoxygenase [Didymella exigua CBS 183.55]KAF1926454.1 Lipoxygenase [Didymella exigua CBS 183.55]